MKRLLLAACLALGVPLRAADPPAFLPDADVLAQAPSLPLEDRRYLVYLYARLNKPHVAEQLAATILRENPSDRQTLLVLASMYVEQKDAAATLRTARTFLGFYPGDHQGRYFLGAGYYLAKRYAEANAELRDLKHEQFENRKYPYETDLAASAYAAGDWYRAMLSYQELLRHHRLGDELRDEVRRVLDEIYRTHLPRFDAAAAETRLDRARVWRYTAGDAQHVSDRHWLALNYTRDDVTLESAPGLRAARSPRAEAAATLTTTYDRRWTSDEWLGASGAGVHAGARVVYRFAKDRTLALEVGVNGRATDSLALEFLDGRQHQAALALSWLVEADLALLARAQVRELHVADATLGRGAGLDLNLDQTLWRQGPHVTVGYRGALATFRYASGLAPALVAPIADPAGGVAAQNALVANLVSRRLNRHGTALLVTDNLEDAWVYRLTAGVDYDFVLSSTGWNAGLSLTFLPRKSLELTVEAGYSSSAAASNAGSAATLLNFSLRSYY